MAGIVCAIRGGPASKPTIKRAISAAKEHDLLLYFLYIVNLDFLAHTSSSRVHTIERELHNMGEFILLSARASAEVEGVEAEGIIRQGSVGDEIIGACEELQADFVVLGKPVGKEEANAFTHVKFGEFVDRIKNECNTDVIQADPE